MQFKCEYMPEYKPCHVVYRHVFDLSKCTLEDGIKIHQVALFISEDEACDYCEYRNHMTEKYNSDDVNLILDFE